jgi:glycosyltransferase involved in cell wall biosynthesis
MKILTVSVIIPSFNRAHLLPMVIPSYYQKYVSEIIIIDDKSTDNTEEVVMALKKSIPIIRYYKSKTKIRQTGAKNIGIQMAKGEYCYFGDDDSVLKDGSIESMVQNSSQIDNSIIAARHLYMKEGQNLENLKADFNDVKFENIDLIYNKDNMQIDLSIKFDKLIEIPYCTYCFLIPSLVAKSNFFFEGFAGTCFREETDYIMRLCSKNMKVYLDYNALSIDLPRSISQGGIYSVKLVQRHLSEIYNEYMFYKRNRFYLSQISTLNSNPYIRAIVHLKTKILSILRGLQSLK